MLTLTGDAFTEQDAQEIARLHGTAEWLRLHSSDGARVLLRA